jgi:hypothetical protein
MDKERSVLQSLLQRKPNWLEYRVREFLFLVFNPLEGASSR